MLQIPSNVCVAIVLALFGLAQLWDLTHGHPDPAHKLSVSYKEQLHGLFAGHGSVHMTKDEAGVILGMANAHREDVLTLISEAKTENYLVQLTNFVRLSNLDDDTKSKFYRDSYEICRQNLDAGGDWNDVMLTLIQNTDTFTDEELRGFLDSGDQYVRQRAEESLEKRKRDREREGRNGSSSNGHDSNLKKDSSKSHELNDGNADTVYTLPVIICGALGVAIAGLLAMMWFRKASA